ncbi:hypothetical protein ACPXCS_33455 [Streptomyces sp. DT190]|uniref:hypothetical protein n=1 Tax=unclassified Streptomyces TaxID=2593676 RepID=UPI003CF937EE
MINDQELDVSPPTMHELVRVVPQMVGGAATPGSERILARLRRGSCGSLRTELRVHAGSHYAIQFHYALSDDAWCVELSEAVAAPAAWAEIPNAEAHLPGAGFLVAVIPDEDPSLEPTVPIHSHDEHVILYEIMRWFMEQVAEQVERYRLALEQGAPEAVE